MNKPEIIEWKLKQLKKFEGARVSTRENQITGWFVDGVDEPTQQELTQWNTEYVQAKAQEKIDRKNKKLNLVNALSSTTGLSIGDVMSGLLAIIKDKDLD